MAIGHRAFLQEPSAFLDAEDQIKVQACAHLFRHLLDMRFQRPVLALGFREGYLLPLANRKLCRDQKFLKLLNPAQWLCLLTPEESRSHH